MIIHNRSWYGEYVYGCLYRGISEDDALDIIKEIDSIYLKYNIDAYYIQLYSSSDALLVKNDDNKSLSQGNIKKIEIEQNRFLEIFDHSLLNKIKIQINNGDEFRNSEEIYQEALNFINNKSC